MAREDIRVGPRRSSRFGPGRSNVFQPRQGRVFRLNEGSSPHSRRNTLSLNQPGGRFGSGRPAGGGVAALLAGLGPIGGVVGQPEVGPPPVPPSPPPGIFGPPSPGPRFPQQTATPNMPGATPPPPQPPMAEWPNYTPSTAELFQAPTTSIFGDPRRRLFPNFTAY